MKGLLTILPDGRYDVRSFAVDEERRNVSAYGVFMGSHTGQGGPVPPTGKSVASDYVYVMFFDGDRIKHVQKISHAGLAMRSSGVRELVVHLPHHGEERGDLRQQAPGQRQVADAPDEGGGAAAADPPAVLPLYRGGRKGQEGGAGVVPRTDVPSSGPLSRLCSLRSR